MCVIDIIREMPSWYVLSLILLSLYYSIRGVMEQYIKHKDDEKLNQYQKIFIHYIQEFLFKAIVSISGFDLLRFADSLIIYPYFSMRLARLPLRPENDKSYLPLPEKSPQNLALGHIQRFDVLFPSATSRTIVPFLQQYLKYRYKKVDRDIPLFSSFLTHVPTCVKQMSCQCGYPP